MRLESPSRLAALDGVRGLAIVLVLLHHYTQQIYAYSTMDTWFLGFTNSTWTGVYLFFVLSGFLITGILYAARGKKRYFIVFWARRALRIFPLYY